MGKDAKRGLKLQNAIVRYVAWCEKTIPRRNISVRKFFNEWFLLLIIFLSAFPELIKESIGKKTAKQSWGSSEKWHDDVVIKIYEESGKNFIKSAETIKSRPSYPREEWHEKFYQIARLYRIQNGAERQIFKEYLLAEVHAGGDSTLWAINMLATLLGAKRVYPDWPIDEVELMRYFRGPLRDLTKTLHEQKTLDDWAKHNSLILLLGDIGAEGVEPYLKEIADKEGQLQRAALISLAKLNADAVLAYLPALYKKHEKQLGFDLTSGFGSLGYGTFSELVTLLCSLHGCKYLCVIAEQIRDQEGCDRSIARAFFQTLLQESIGSKIFRWYERKISPHPWIVSGGCRFLSGSGKASWLERQLTLAKIKRILKAR